MRTAVACAPSPRYTASSGRYEPRTCNCWPCLLALLTLPGRGSSSSGTAGAVTRAWNSRCNRTVLFFNGNLEVKHCLCSCQRPITVHVPTRVQYHNTPLYSERRPPCLTSEDRVNILVVCDGRRRQVPSPITCPHASYLCANPCFLNKDLSPVNLSSNFSMCPDSVKLSVWV